jgi:DNA modification methylase
LGRAYETFFICRKGSPALRKAGRSNVFLFKPTSHQRKIHPTEKPIELYQEFLDTFVYPGSYCLVPFLGSGAMLRACYSRGLTGWGWNLEDSYKEAFLSRVFEDEQQGLYGQVEEP